MTKQQLPRLWAIVGATGTGKSALSLELAKQLDRHGRGAEVVNADAMQLYRGMDIGTAKLSVHERQVFPHHLFDVLDVTEEATVAWYQAAAREIITEIHNRGNDAVLVGGSGLYVSSVIFDFQFPPRDEALRAQLEARLDAEGVEPLLRQLEERAPEVAQAVDTHNPRRVIRALEVALLGGDAQVTLPQDPVLWQEHTRVLGLHCERARLTERLDQRVTQMWRTGLLDEVAALLPQGLAQGKTASQAIGYAQAFAQLNGELDEAGAIEETQRLTRRYARRQVSWFKRYPDIEWIESGSLPASLIGNSTAGRISAES